MIRGVSEDLGLTMPERIGYRKLSGLRCLSASIAETQSSTFPFSFPIQLAIDNSPSKTTGETCFSSRLTNRLADKAHSKHLDLEVEGAERDGYALAHCEKLSSPNTYTRDFSLNEGFGLSRCHDLNLTRASVRSPSRRHSPPLSRKRLCGDTQPAVTPCSASAMRPSGSSRRRSWAWRFVGSAWYLGSLFSLDDLNEDSSEASSACKSRLAARSS